MPSKLELVNRVLSELGKLPVIEITDQDDSKLISNKIDELYPELLLSYNWNFAIVYVNDSSPLTNNYSPDYTYTYQLPGNFGKLFKFASSGAQWPYYEIIDGYLLAQTNPVQYYYIVNSADYSVLPPLFSRALVLYTAAKCAPQLTQNAQLFQYLEAEHYKKLTEAIIQNDMDRSIMSTPYNDFDRITFI